MIRRLANVVYGTCVAAAVLVVIVGVWVGGSSVQFVPVYSGHKEKIDPEMVEEAHKVGYSDREIVEYLKKYTNYDVESALSDGKSYAEILQDFLRLDDVRQNPHFLQKVRQVIADAFFQIVAGISLAIAGLTYAFGWAFRYVLVGR